MSVTHETELLRKADECIVKLQAENTQLKAERDAAQAALKDDKSKEEVIGMNLGYSIIEIHQMEHDLNQTKQQLDRANAACADLKRRVIEMAEHEHCCCDTDGWKLNKDGEYVKEPCYWCKHKQAAKSTDCGKGWLNPDVGKLLVQTLRNVLEVAELIDDANGHLSQQIVAALDVAKKAGCE